MAHVNDNQAHSLEALANQLTRLTAEVDALRAEVRNGPAPQDVSSQDRFWALDTLREAFTEQDSAELLHNGAVLFTGTTQPPGSPGPLEWQWTRTGADLTESDWGDATPRLSALAHPVRIALLQAVYRGTETVADLVASGEFGTKGQVYHHLTQLVSAGWLSASRRGHYAVPPERVISLLVIISAAS